MVKDSVKENIKNTYIRFFRVRLMAWIVGAAVMVLLSRLFYLQVIKGAYYKKIADSNCVNLVKDRAPRGYIYDRNYKPLVVNKPSYSVSIIPFYFSKNKDFEKAVNGLSLILDMDPEDIKEKLAQTREYKLEPITIKRGLSEKELSVLRKKALRPAG
jgi:penicillin-binding protein 2